MDHASRSTLRVSPSALLAVGAAAGILLAAAGILRTGSSSTGALPAGVIAQVNGHAIRLQDYERAINALAQDRRSGIDATQRKLVVDRLIDDELLLERAMELGLARDDLRVRRALTGAVIESVVADQDSIQPSDRELRSFYDSERDFFTSPGQLRLRQIWLRASTPADTDAALDRARKAITRLRSGDDFSSVKHDLGDQEIAPLPDALVPVTKLGDYLGPTAMRTALGMKTGEISDPVRSNTGYHVLQLVERRSAEPPPFEDIKPQVAAEFRRRASEQALRTYLDDLRSRADVTVAAELP
ncbi:MAG: peptidyl-prolyl cis-trans isomerase [Deltaproteobacteria bacterium]|nr:peptidyl-prolyl cis-trans isomerase [Deltaproteobacteria bacterium]